MRGSVDAAASFAAVSPIFDHTLGKLVALLPAVVFQPAAVESRVKLVLAPLFPQSVYPIASTTLAVTKVPMPSVREMESSPVKLATPFAVVKDVT